MICPLHPIQVMILEEDGRVIKSLGAKSYVANIKIDRRLSKNKIKKLDIYSDCKYWTKKRIINICSDCKCWAKKKSKIRHNKNCLERQS